MAGIKLTPEELANIRTQVINEAPSKLLGEVAIERLTQNRATEIIKARELQIGNEARAKAKMALGPGVGDRAVDRLTEIGIKERIDSANAASIASYQERVRAEVVAGLPEKFQDNKNLINRLTNGRVEERMVANGLRIAAEEQAMETAINKATGFTPKIDEFLSAGGKFGLTERVAEDVARIDRIYTGYAKPAMLGIAALIGAATLIDVSQRLLSKRAIHQERNEKERQYKEQQKKTRQNAEGVPQAFMDVTNPNIPGAPNDPYQGLVQSLFEQRIGHYRQGNARFGR